MPHVTSKDGTTIAYDVSGAGPLLVTVAGATQFRAVDREGTPLLAQLLAGDFTVIIYDRRGRGDSTDTLPSEVAREVEDIDALVAAHGAPAYLFGMSSGALLALEAAAALGDKIAGVVLYEPPVDPNKSAADYQADYRQMADLAADERAEDMLSLFLGGVMPPDQFEGFKQSPAWAAYAAAGKSLAHDYQVMAAARSGDTPPSRWFDIKAPVLVMDGDASFPFMKAGADWVAGGLPHGARKSLAGQTHQYDPRLVAPEILGFFGKR
jgi:pimeloyl-ACP methyl ester carboxylesterase